MDLHSGTPYWIAKSGLIETFPRLDAPVSCDVAIVGAGITGALIAERLSRDGSSVCVIDRREAGWGSSAASTGLLQYEIDTELQDLAERYGEDDAVLAYRACQTAVRELLVLARRVGKVDIKPMRSLYYASHWYHRTRLRREAALRLRHGFELEVLEPAAIESRFGLRAPVGVLTTVAAEIDPYQMAKRLLRRVVGRGGLVFDRTAMASFRTRRGGVDLVTHDGLRIRARHLVIAAGYESQTYLDARVARNHSSYAFASDPVPGGLGPLADCLAWESARPYLYVRSTLDDRLIVGGLDDRIDIAARRDLRVSAKTQALHKQVARLFPWLSVEPAFAWAGTFAETEDGLPFFGPHPQYGPRVHFAMAYGGNGISYSQIGSAIIAARLAGESHPCERLFSFARIE